MSSDSSSFGIETSEDKSSVEIVEVISEKSEPTVSQGLTTFISSGVKIPYYRLLSSKHVSTTDLNQLKSLAQPSSLNLQSTHSIETVEEKKNHAPQDQSNTPNIYNSF